MIFSKTTGPFFFIFWGFNLPCLLFKYSFSQQIKLIPKKFIFSWFIPTNTNWNKLRLVSIWEILGHLKPKKGFLQKKCKMAPNLYFERPSDEDTAENLCFSGQYITKVQFVSRYDKIF